MCVFLQKPLQHPELSNSQLLADFLSPHSMESQFLDKMLPDVNFGMLFLSEQVSITTHSIFRHVHVGWIGGSGQHLCPYISVCLCPYMTMEVPYMGGLIPIYGALYICVSLSILMVLVEIPRSRPSRSIHGHDWITLGQDPMVGHRNICVGPLKNVMSWKQIQCFFKVISWINQIKI